jgi:hypothetical protein
MVEAITSKTTATTKTTTTSDAATNRAALNQASDKAKTAALNAQPLNPRLVYDRLAGVVVTEFLNSSGVVQLQAPSAAVLAYLRVGLGSDGRSLPSDDPQPKTNPDTIFDS